MAIMDKSSDILVLGAGGMVGSAIVRELKKQGYSNVAVSIHDEWGSTDLTKMKAVNGLFARKQPEYVFLCAAKAGGIKANSEEPVDFLQINLNIQSNVIQCCYESKVKRLIFLGSSCIYPRMAPQPMKEEYLMTGELEPTNRPYAIAKIAGIELCRAYNRQHGTDFISVMPCNLYGNNDRYTDSGHVIPMLMRKFVENDNYRKVPVSVWGTGAPKREFLHADDLARCLIQLMNCSKKLPNLINIGSNEEVTIKELAEKIATIVGCEGGIVWDESRPDGTPRKLLDCSLLKEILPEWKPTITLEEGLKSMLEDYKNIKCEKEKT